MPSPARCGRRISTMFAFRRSKRTLDWTHVLPASVPRLEMSLLRQLCLVRDRDHRRPIDAPGSDPTKDRRRR
jgi:hypothetical protein